MKKGFSKDFYLVVIGQIISLFGNAVIRFALPLHLLSVTGSAALLGVVSGVAFLPLVVMSPIGGLIADRMNKRNIMVVLDFFTAGLVLLFLVLSGRGSLVSLILIMLFLLYGISGAYQPSVQASIPLLVSEEAVMPANAIINMVSSLSGLLGPALGGIAYGLWGITPILYVCMGCFFLSAVMEIFIHIPFVKRVRTDTLLHETIADMKSSLIFIGREKKEIGKLTFCCAAVNLFLSALMIVSLPVIVTQVLVFPRNNASEMYGFLEALMAGGGLLGGLGAGLLSKRLNVRSTWKLLFCCGMLLLPMGAALYKGLPVYLAYLILADSYHGDGIPLYDSGNVLYPDHDATRADRQGNLMDYRSFHLCAATGADHVWLPAGAFARDAVDRVCCDRSGYHAFRPLEQTGGATAVVRASGLA